MPFSDTAAREIARVLGKHVGAQALEQTVADGRDPRRQGLPRQHREARKRASDDPLIGEIILLLVGEIVLFHHSTVGSRPKFRYEPASPYGFSCSQLPP